MKWRLPALAILLLFLFMGVFRSYAQPVLPDIDGATGKGIVMLSWTCQYDGVKTIVVRRSADSMFNYKIVGYVRKTARGVQAFVDGHPQAGNNYYKLNIVFNSGLNWSSNRRRVFIDSAQIASRSVSLPSNDSLQHYTITEVVADTAPKPGTKKVGGSDTAANKGRGRSVELSFNVILPDTTAPTDMVAVTPPIVRRKIVLSFPEPDIEEATFIKSVYVSVNPLTGHVEIRLPADAKEHKYSLKFYNRWGKEVLDIPQINSAFSILDKRNFQKKGSYKVVLKKDGTVFETAYVDVNL